MLDPGTILNHRYRILSLLGAGGMGEVYLVEDPQMIQRKLALKLTRKSMVTREEIRAMKREFTFLKRLFHPNIPRVFDFGHTKEGRAYYTAEYLEGQDLESLDISGKWRLITEITVQICRALSFLHSRRLVHHDVKPENIRIVGDLDASFTVKLVDFGLSSEKKAGIKGIKGSLETMAPEILEDKPHDHRVDLYALGAVLFRIATGKSPFPMDDLAESLKLRLTADVPSPRNFQPDIPEAIDAVIRKLLSLDPDHRYQTAREIVVDLGERLGEPLEPETTQTLKCYIDSGDFTAHKETYQALSKLIDDAVKGTFPGGIMICGERGIGTSRLIREIHTYAQLKRISFFRIGCATERGITLEPVFDIARFWKDLPENELKEIIGVEGSIGKSDSRFDPLKRQRHLLKAADWFENNAIENPVILVFEDIQLADQLTLDFLKYLIHRINNKYLSIWITRETTSTGTENADAFLDLLRVQKFTRFQLQPMDDAGCRTLVKSMFPSNLFQDEFYSKLHEASGGNPSHLKLLLYALVDRGLIRLHGEVWDFAGSILDVEHSQNLEQLFMDRIRIIQDDTKEVATVLGVTRGALRLSVLSAILNKSENETTEALTPLLHNGWISQFQRDGYLWVGFNHPGFYTAVTSDLASDQIQKLHLSVARYFQENEPTDDPRVQEILGYQWLKIGNAEEVAKYALSAGNAMLDRMDPHAARDYWQEALHLLRQHPKQIETTQQVMIALAGLLRDIGESRQSIDTYQGIRQNLDDNDIDLQVQCLNQIALMQDRLGDTEEAKNNWMLCLDMLKEEFHKDIGIIYGGLGWLAFREGNHEEALDYCWKGIKLLKHREISPQKAYLLNTMGTLCFYRGEIEEALKTWRKALKVRQSLGHKKGISDLHNNIGAALNALGRHKGAKWHWNRCLEISQQLGDIERMAGICNNLGVQAYERGKLLEADRYYQQACDIFNRLGARRDIASLLNNLGEVSLQRADYLKAMEYWQQALEIGQDLADQESQIEPLYQLGHLYLLLGDHQEAEAHLSESESLANKISASGSLGSIYELLARLTLQSGGIDQAKHYCEKSLKHLKRSGDQVKLARGWVTRAQIAVALNDEKMMNSSLKEANKLSKETGEQHLQVTGALCTLNYYIDARANKSEAKDIISVLKEVLEMGVSFPELLWQAHWMQGRFLRNQGRWKAALDAYSHAISILKRISRKLTESHQSNYLKGPVKQKFRQEAIEIKKLVKGETQWTTKVSS